MAKVKMDKDVQRRLRREILKFKKDEFLTWKSMQKIDLKKKYEMPCQWQMLFNIASNKGAHPNNVKALLDYFKIPANKENLKVTLKEEKPKEDAAQ